VTDDKRLAGSPTEPHSAENHDACKRRVRTHLANHTNGAKSEDNTSLALLVHHNTAQVKLDCMFRYLIDIQAAHEQSSDNHDRRLRRSGCDFR
jgi:hypothetical protein